MFGKKRGQAFDTMMLVVSVVVALAILGVLMGIITDINPNVDDPKKIIHGQVAQQANLFGSSTAQKLSIKQDVAFVSALDVIGSTTLREDEFAFRLSDSAAEIPGNEDGARLVLKKGEYQFVVCGDTENMPIKYGVAVGRNAVEANEACVVRECSR
ncbi:hypothetical protein AUJ65_02670 [Candidatus Micrarchaeota archaeon CG1_02_51_15]|nr:MAG: hypothetical protein AUJ65_02670 [Candidatus Micrarchaeota archaeon CG1_02_51_15]